MYIRIMFIDFHIKSDHLLSLLNSLQILLHCGMLV